MANDNLTGQLFGGSWTEKKLEILKRYLEAYTKALKNQPFNKVYIDAFAGTGYRQKRKEQIKKYCLIEDLEIEEKLFFKGSAKIALEVNPSFDRYIFIENDESKIKELKKLKDDYPDKEERIQIEKSDANEFIQSYCISENWKDNRAVMFLDPFATEVDWVTIEAIAKTKSIDVWILFPIMAVNRLLANKEKRVRVNCLNQILGTTEWYEKFYKFSQRPVFFEEFKNKEKVCNIDDIKNFYNEQLKKIFSGVAENPKVFYNSRNSPLFIFFFAVGNKKGTKPALSIAQHLLSKEF